LLLTHMVAPQLAWLAPWLRDAVMVVLMCTALSYFLPALTRVLGRWLHPKE
jgi:antibiotic biosynthesis monooxygenase (ABM) superfamily enzyme